MINVSIRLKKIVGVRVENDLYELLGKVARARGEDVSDFVRRAIRRELAGLSYLTLDEKKALGVASSTAISSICTREVLST